LQVHGILRRQTKRLEFELGIGRVHNYLNAFKRTKTGQDQDVLSAMSRDGLMYKIGQGCECQRDSDTDNVFRLMSNLISRFENCVYVRANCQFMGKWFFRNNHRQNKTKEDWIMDIWTDEYEFVQALDGSPNEKWTYSSQKRTTRRHKPRESGESERVESWRSHRNWHIKSKSDSNINRRTT
jgi:hypothetical protein